MNRLPAALIALAITVPLAVVIALTWPAQAARPAPSTSSWAVVNTDGSLARSSGAPASVATGTDGAYVVTFGKDVSHCAYSVTGGAASANDVLDDAVVFTAAPSLTGPNDVYVLEYDTVLARDSYSSGFHLVVSC